MPPRSRQDTDRKEGRRQYRSLALPTSRPLLHLTPHQIRTITTTTQVICTPSPPFLRNQIIITIITTITTIITTIIIVIGRPVRRPLQCPEEECQVLSRARGGAPRAIQETSSIDESCRTAMLRTAYRLVAIMEHHPFSATSTTAALSPLYPAVTKT